MLKNQEKEMLIQSMMKLLEHIHKSQFNKEDIFSSLSKSDLNKIIKNTQDSNITLRKISGVFLCLVLARNPKNISRFCDLMNLVAMQGKLCLNKIPSCLNKQPNSLLEVVQSVRNVDSQYLSQPKLPTMWFINTTTKQFHTQCHDLEGFKNVNQIIHHFIDPYECVFGIFICQKIEKYFIGKKEKTKVSQSVESPKIKKNSLQEKDYQNTQQAQKKSSLQIQPQNLQIDPVEYYKQNNRTNSINNNCKTDRENQEKPQEQVYQKNDTKPSHKEKLKLHLEQFVSPMNKKNILFNNICKNLVIEDQNKVNHQPMTTTNSNINAKLQLFSPQHNQHPRLNFGSFVEQNNYQKIDRKNFITIVESSKNEGIDRMLMKNILKKKGEKTESVEKINNIVSRFINFYDKNTKKSGSGQTQVQQNSQMKNTPVKCQQSPKYNKVNYYMFN